MSWWLIAAIVGITCLLMELVTWAIHKYIMHGIAWRWHKTHHRNHDDIFELNDLFALIFAGLAIGLLVLGQQSPWLEWLFWSGIGVCLYGFMYVLVHDVITHRRLPFDWYPKRGYLRRLVEAHHLHHASRSRKDSVSYGFLYAPPVDKLRERLKRRNRQREFADQHEQR